MTYHITKVPQSCGHAYQVSAPLHGGVGKVVAEIRFLDMDRDMGLLASRAAMAMVESMAPIWTLTAEGPRASNVRGAETRTFTREEIFNFQESLKK